jgi:hypothetical protein
VTETHHPRTLLEFQRAFPDEGACAAHLEKLRWPEGFTCSGCGSSGEPWRRRSRPTVLRCRSCRLDVRLTAGTIMRGTRTPLLVWFWGAYLQEKHWITRLACGCPSDLSVHRILGLPTSGPANGARSVGKADAWLVRRSRSQCKAAEFAGDCSFSSPGEKVTIFATLWTSRSRPSVGSHLVPRQIFPEAWEVRMEDRCRDRGERLLERTATRQLDANGRRRTNVVQAVQKSRAHTGRVA